MKSKTGLAAFMDILNVNKKNLTSQQYRIIKGQAFAGNIRGAEKVCISCLTGSADN